VKSNNQKDDDDKSLLIDHIYQVAIDPERYETLLDLWEEKIAPLRTEKDGEQATPSPFQVDELKGHAERAAIFIDRMDDNGGETYFSNLVSSIEPAAAMIVSNAFELTAINDAAKIVFDVTVGDPMDKIAKHFVDFEGVKEEFEKRFKSAKPQTTLLRLLSADNKRTVVLRLRPIENTKGKTSHLLVVSSELAWPEGLDHTIREAFGLTNAETEIVRQLTKGYSLKDIAESRGRSFDTVKTQLRSILSKTHVHTQSELVRVTLGLMDVVVATETKATLKTPTKQSNDGLLPVPFRTMTHASGRKFDHIVLGSETWRPILFFPLHYGLTRWKASAEKFARENDFKIIVTIRPGFGHSTKLDKRSNLIDWVMDDINILLDHYQVSTCPVICMSSDSFFAYHFAERFPGRLTAILNCAPGFPMFLPIQYERMQKWHRFILANARYAPSMLPFLVKAGFSLAKRIGKRGFIHAVYGNSKGDIATFEDPETFEAMIEGSEICLSDWHSAHEAFSNEVIVQQNDWSDLVRNCQIPVHVWYGDQDPQVPLGTVAELKAEFQEINFIPVENAGQLLIFNVWKDVLQMAEKYMEKGK